MTFFTYESFSIHKNIFIGSTVCFVQSSFLFLVSYVFTAMYIHDSSIFITIYFLFNIMTYLLVSSAYIYIGSQTELTPPKVILFFFCNYQKYLFQYFKVHLCKLKTLLITIFDCQLDIS